MLRHNVVGIQMLRKSIRDHIFKNKINSRVLTEEDKLKVYDHLKTFKIPYEKVQTMDSVDLNLPPLKGETIAEHFKNIANKQVGAYMDMANKLAGASLPKKPEKWLKKEGWTKYDAATGSCSPVEYPNEEVMVIDVETFVPSGGHPLMVVAVSPTCWYSWCSGYLSSNKTISGSPKLSDLVRVAEENNPRRKALLVGHNIGFDRSFMREQYFVEPSNTNFMDTMAMHVAICGLTSYQRLLYVAQKNKVGDKPAEGSARAMLKWMSKSCPNGLSDVFQFHCKKKALDKQPRNFFVEGSIDEINENFQELMTYCSEDVRATHEVFKVLWPKFKQRFPHPVTLGGMFEMGKSYLPVNENWFKYIASSNAKYEELQDKGKELLTGLVEEARLKFDDESYKKDIWLWDLDWSKKSKKLKNIEAPSEPLKKPKKMSDKAPKWYMELCEMDDNNNLLPSLISLQRRVAVKLLQMVWNGFPLHHSKKHGWGYLVPFSSDAPLKEALEERRPEDSAGFPLQQLIDYCNNTQPDVTRRIHKFNSNSEQFGSEILEEMESLWDSCDPNELESRSTKTTGEMEELPILNVVPGCYFYKLPRKDGGGANVGSPLSKDFHHDIDQGTLSSLLGKSVEGILKQGSIFSYWKNNVKRISSQLVIGLSHEDLSDIITGDENYKEGSYQGVILPRTVTAGTVTRRAVEATWMTASNAYNNRIGSELKSMVQSPPGYSFVGADVDSQELWISAILGDAHFAGEHGCTAFGWMTLQGSKAEGTDMHSRVAEMLGISRESAKIFNYGRIYGAGLKFAEQMLRKFNTQISREEAKERATKMFQSTKGVKVRSKFSDNGVYQAPYWQGGSESQMFNKLEKVASLSNPKTPVLKASMSQAIEPAVVGKDFMTSRINWVVQSSAVDYLHLMLVCMRWLFEEYHIRGRFCISIHDEVRYLVPDEDKYRAALALQITNLFTRSMFAHALQFDDLPQSVAFFSSVEIDRCLRKDALSDCTTPSNEKGLLEGYLIPKGESLTIADILEKTGGELKGTSKEDLQE